MTDFPHIPSIRRAQADVLEFHDKFKRAIGVKPGNNLDDRGQRMLKINMLMEEAGELCEALGLKVTGLGKTQEIKPNIIGVADGVADVIYVALGIAITFGIDLEPVWEAVHAANMAKTGGGENGEGKIMKPAGWKPPDVESILKAQGWSK